MSRALREQISRRAEGRCEYCRVPAEYDVEFFCVDHVIAKKHHGPTTFENLAYSCYWCNSYKGDNLAGIDPVTGQIVRLFNPRTDEWLRNFRWEGPFIVGVSDSARATIDVLCMNAASRIELRATLLKEGISF